MSRMDEIYFGLVQSYSKLQAENTKLKEELAAAQARENAAFCIHCECPVFNAPSAIDALYTVKHQEHEAGYNQCLKELSEREPVGWLLKGKHFYPYTDGEDITKYKVVHTPLTIRPTYPKE